MVKFKVTYPQLDGVRINENRTLPVSLLQAIRKAYDYIATLASSVETVVANSAQSVDVIQDTHANRMLYPAGTYALGSFYFETDRLVTYLNSTVASVNEWVRHDGQMSGLLAARPTDLTTNDAGFTYYATDSFTLYVWDGTAWSAFREMGSLLANTHANRAVRLPATFATNAQYLETDRNTLYRNTGAAWIVARGLIHECVQASLPTLGADDTGFLAWVTDYSHMLEWSGAAWGWGPGESGNGFIQGFLVAPTANGWHVCDGSVVAYLKADGTTTTVTLPDLTSAGNKASYLKFGATASATLVAPIAPTLTMASYTPAGTVTAPTFTGSAATTSAVSAGTVNPHNGLVFGVTVGGTNIQIFNGAGDLSHTALSTHTHTLTATGTNSTPAFSGTPATLTGSI